jgi:hypothetical protein
MAATRSHVDPDASEKLAAARTLIQRRYSQPRAAKIGDASLYSAN